jgi:hypothetical protein
MSFAWKLRASMVLGAALVAAACSGLSGSGHACRHDDDCKGARVCGPDAMCIEPGKPRDDGGAMGALDGSHKPDDAASERKPDAESLREPDATTVPPAEPCVPNQGCYELVLDDDVCPGIDWQMSDVYWACDALSFVEDGKQHVVRWLNFFAATWTREQTAVAWGPNLTIAGHELVEMSIGHRFNRYGGNPSAVVKLVAQGADPHASGFILWKAKGGGNQRESAFEKAQVRIADLPEEVREEARIVLLTGGNEGVLVSVPMSWDIIHLRVQAK